MGASSPRIGFVGLGHQGAQLVRRLIDRGYSVIGFDSRPEATATLASTGMTSAACLREVLEDNAFVAVCVSDDTQLEAVMLGESGLIEVCMPGQILIIHSTVSPTILATLGRAAEGRGAFVVDAPVSGGNNPAAQDMSFMVGGRPEAVERCLPLFGEVGENVTITGGPGSGVCAKLAHQAIFCMNLMAASEGMRLGTAAGVEPAVLQSIMASGTAQSRVAERWFQIPHSPEYRPILAKDLRLALGLAADLGIHIPGAGLALERIADIVP